MNQTKRVCVIGAGSRHSTQVDFHLMHNELKADLKKIGINIGNPPMGKVTQYKKAFAL
jgi:hypothetical protein